jgi:phytoene synthase
VRDPALRSAYRECRRANARHGRTFYLATLLLPPARRPYVHALYAFARHVDDIVDETDVDAVAAGRALDRLERAFLAGDAEQPVLAAVLDTVDRWSIPTGLFTDFFTSMRMDLGVTEYATWDALLAYMHGSAAVIGLQTLPILEPMPGVAKVAADYAADLGLAFQLTNFIRDVGEDLRRGRLYLPKDDLATFAVSRDDLEHGLVTDEVRTLLAFQVNRARELFRHAAHGIRLLHPSSRDCIRVAHRLYGAILDEVERADYRVLDRRVSVGVGRRAAVAAPGMLRAWLARRPHHTHHASVWRTSENPNSRSSTGA